MSASLVGSGDVYKRQVSNWFLLGFTTLNLANTPSNTCALSSAALSPVSYTHLTLPTICSV
eukprot:1998203-Alexandrium_andersonii.AAC.1